MSWLEEPNYVSKDGPWLSPHSSSEMGLNADLLGDLLRDHRRVHRISQADLARLLHLDQSYVSKIETGRRQVTDVETLLWIAQQLNVAPARVGLSDELLRPVGDPAGSSLAGDVDPVAVSQDRWRRTRRSLNRSRRDLARVAAGLYRPEARVGTLPFLALPHWMPERPIPLHDIRLSWNERPEPVRITGGEPEAAAVLPLRAPGKAFARYTSAVRYLDPPRLFENRTSYRLLDVNLRDDPRMEFSLAAYFDKLDLAEAVAHELAAASSRPGWESLPLRALVGEPFDLHRRYVMPGIQSLTIRRNRDTGAATFLLHWRDPARVATGGGNYGVIPSGEFQPSTIATHDRENDFDLWRSMVREFSEELLGEPERDGSSGEPLNYPTWDLYRDLESARTTGKVRSYCLGLGLNALTLSAAVLTVTVFDDDVFDDLFGSTVQVNAEGVLVSAIEATKVSEGIPFTSESVSRLVDHEPVGPAAACILRRSDEFRSVLLDTER